MKNTKKKLNGHVNHTGLDKWNKPDLQDCCFFIVVPAKIIRSVHQIELKMYEHLFFKSDWEELDRQIEAA